MTEIKHQAVPPKNPQSGDTCRVDGVLRVFDGVDWTPVELSAGYEPLVISHTYEPSEPPEPQDVERYRTVATHDAYADLAADANSSIKGRVDETVSGKDWSSMNTNEIIDEMSKLASEIVAGKDDMPSGEIDFTPYVWKTQGDARIRPEHGRIGRAWTEQDPPNPFTPRRCFAELVSQPVEIKLSDIQAAKSENVDLPTRYARAMNESIMSSFRFPVGMLTFTPPSAPAKPSPATFGHPAPSEPIVPVEHRKVIADMLGLPPPGSRVERALKFINKKRWFMHPLDPVASKWTDDDVIREALENGWDGR